MARLHLLARQCYCLRDLVPKHLAPTITLSLTTAHLHAQSFVYYFETWALNDVFYSQRILIVILSNLRRLRFKNCCDCKMCMRQLRVCVISYRGDIAVRVIVLGVIVPLPRDVETRRNHRHDADIILIDCVSGCHGNHASSSIRYDCIYVVSLRSCFARDVTDDITYYAKVPRTVLLNSIQ